MPRGDGTGPRGQGAGTGRGVRGGGQGQGGGRGQGSGGPGGDCVCQACGERVPHRLGVSCLKERCPKCGAAMIRG